MKRYKIPYIGSYQTGNKFRSGDPLNSSWKYLRRIGTIENLTRLAKLNNIPLTIVSKAALRFNQAIEFRDSVKHSSILTKPTLLYYSTLNLLRGLLYPFVGDADLKRHGLNYIRGDSILDCKAKINNKGTFPGLLKILKIDQKDFSGKSFSLLDFLIQIPELLNDIHLITKMQTNVTYAKVNAFTNDHSTIEFHNLNISEEIFEKDWPLYFPWFKDLCTFQEPYTLKINNMIESHSEIINFCNTKLMRSLEWRDDPIWYDQVSTEESFLLPRIATYFGALFIISNISRYEPELFEEINGLNNLSYVINQFLDSVEKSFPLLLIELSDGPTYFL